MPYLPPPESPRARRRREAREARAAELGCTLEEVLLVERLERWQEDAREVSEAGREEHLRGLLARRRANLQLFVEGRMDHTLEERAGAEAQVALLEEALVNVAAFVGADGAALAQRAAAAWARVKDSGLPPGPLPPPPGPPGPPLGG
jgi:hypothetical protein